MSRSGGGNNDNLESIFMMHTTKQAEVENLQVQKFNIVADNKCA